MEGSQGRLTARMEVNVEAEIRASQARWEVNIEEIVKK
jgi:hypothetical protein